jgi:G:T-mismatch repair DNA endonuclease (very short patch repair protein)
MEDDQDEVNNGQHIGHITSGGQITSNVYGCTWHHHNCCRYKNLKVYYST